MGMQDKERIARIGSIDPGSHLGIPFSHVSAKKNFKISCGNMIRVRDTSPGRTVSGLNLKLQREYTLKSVSH
jgi:hypothetical protein